MTRTPWGDAAQLRAQMLPPGPATPPERVAASQRTRLLAALVATVDGQGYEATTVKDLIGLAGVSRAAFYRHFANLEECFLAAVDAIADRSGAAIAAAYARPGGWEERLGAALDTGIKQIVDQPAAARTCLVAVHAAGPAALKRDDWALDREVRMVRAALVESPARADLPPPVVRGIVGGVRRVIHSRLRRGTEAELPALAGGLWRWACSYEAPPGRLLQPRPRSLPQPSNGHGGGQAERMLVAFADTVAARGYAQTTVAEVASRGSASIGTFYQHFDNKPDALVAAIDMIGAHTLAAAGPASRRAADWPQGIRAALKAMLLHLAEHPAWARLVIVEALAADSAALDRLDESVEAFRDLLQAGADHDVDEDTHGVATEAIGGAVLSLCHAQIRRRGPEHLPTLLPVVTYLALAPFVGARQALAVANGDGGEPRPRR